MLRIDFLTHTVRWIFQCAVCLSSVFVLSYAHAQVALLPVLAASSAEAPLTPALKLTGSGAPSSPWEGWSLLLLIPLIGILMWRNYKRTGEIPFLNFLSKFNDEAQDGKEEITTDSLGRFKTALSQHMSLGSTPTKILTGFFWVILFFTLVSITSQFWLPLIKG